MFKAIAADRPYPASGLTTALWANVPVRTVAIRALIATQDHLKIAALRPDHRGSHSGDPIVHVVKWEERLYLEDGHHRVIREAIAGSALVNARVLDLDARQPAPVDAGAPVPAEARTPESVDVPPGLVMVLGKGYRSPHIAKALSGHYVVDWHDWSPGTEDAHKPLAYKDVA